MKDNAQRGFWYVVSLWIDGLVELDKHVARLALIRVLHGLVDSYRPEARDVKPDAA